MEAGRARRRRRRACGHWASRRALDGAMAGARDAAQRRGARARGAPRVRQGRRRRAVAHGAVPRVGRDGVRAGQRHRGARALPAGRVEQGVDGRGERRALEHVGAPRGAGGRRRPRARVPALGAQGGSLLGLGSDGGRRSRGAPASAPPRARCTRCDHVDPQNAEVGGDEAFERARGRCRTPTTCRRAPPPRASVEGGDARRRAGAELPATARRPAAAAGAAAQAAVRRKQRRARASLGDTPAPSTAR